MYKYKFGVDKFVPTGPERPRDAVRETTSARWQNAQRSTLRTSQACSPHTRSIPDAIGCTKTHAPMRSMPDAEPRIARFLRKHTQMLQFLVPQCACSTCRCRCAARKGQDAVSVRLRSRLSHLRAISRASCPGAREPQARVRVKKKVISGSHRLPFWTISTAHQSTIKDCNRPIDAIVLNKTALRCATHLSSVTLSPALCARSCVTC